MSETPIISIIFCSYNRGELLEEVLNYTFENVKDLDKCEVIVVDNNSTDDTKKRIENLKQKHFNLRYEIEPKQGLSNARNRAIELAKAQYLLYLDDDALSDKNLISNYLNTIKLRPDIKVIGGVYKPWYKYGKPVWYKDQYASSRFKKRGLHELTGEQYISGNNMLFHKDSFEIAGSFDPDLGMKENVTYYGEETDLQKRMQRRGIRVFGDDRLIINHIVLKHKLTLMWFFHQKAMLGKSQAKMFSGVRILEAIKAVVIGFSQAIVYIFKNVFQLSKESYRLQNFLIDSFAKPFKWISYAYFLMFGVK